MRRGFRQAGSSIVQRRDAPVTDQPAASASTHSASSTDPARDSLDSLMQQPAQSSQDTIASHTEQDLSQYPSVDGFIFCTFFDDEKLWTAEYGGPNDCEVTVSGHVCEGGYLYGTGPFHEYHVNCTIVSGDSNAPEANAKIIVDGLVRHCDGAPLGRCVFEKQRPAGRQGYKNLATWRMSACHVPQSVDFQDERFKLEPGHGMLRPGNRRFSSDYKVMTDDDWGDMDVWLALRGVTPVFDQVGIDLRPIHFANLTTSDYLDKTNLIALTRNLCSMAGPSTFTQSMLDEWGELYRNPSHAARPKFLPRIHCRYWFKVFLKILDFKIGW